MKKKFMAAVMALVMIGMTPVGVFADTMVKSYLTGLDVPESEGRVRPVAVMLNNIKQGCPQSGIANAITAARNFFFIDVLLSDGDHHLVIPRSSSAFACLASITAASSGSI